MTKAEDVHTVSKDWRTYSSANGITGLRHSILPLELVQAMFIGMDPPKHDRLKALFQRGFTPKRIAEHEPEIREITRGVLDRLDGRETCDLVNDVAQPVVSRVIGSFMGIPPEDDAIWARLMNATLAADDEDLSPGGDGDDHGAGGARDLRALPPPDRGAAREPDRRPDQRPRPRRDRRRHASRSTRSSWASSCSSPRATTRPRRPTAPACGRSSRTPSSAALLLDDPAQVPAAVEESLRMFPAFAHFARTATADVELNGAQIKEGDKVVMWYLSSNRDEDRYEDVDRFDLRRNPEHQAFGAGGRHFCLGTALARLELRVLIEETLARYPRMELAGEPKHATTMFVNQLKTLPVRLNAS